MKSSKFVLLSTLYFLLSTFLIGCAEIEPPTAKEIVEHPFGKGPLKLGMTKEEIKSLWGEPDVVRVLKSDAQGMVQEEWIYRGRYPGIPLNVGYLKETQHLFFDGEHLVKFYQSKGK